MPLILGTNSIKDTSYDVANSARFDDGSSDNIQRTYGTPTNSKIFGLSWWVKLGKAFDGSGSQDLWGERTDSNNRVFMGINSTGQFDFFEKNSGSNVVELKTNRLFRDNSAWYHFLLLGDSTQGTASNRIKLYVNGVQETSFATETYPSSDYAFRLALNTVKYFGRVGLGGSLSTNYYDGYLAEAVFVDGTVTAHTDYGEFDSDSPTIWKPKNVSGLTFGNNGFYLDFEDSSALGNDVSGNDNDFTVNNLTAVDQSTDTCTNNFATLNPLLDVNNPQILSNGNLTATGSGSGNHRFAGSTMPVASGKWYYEVKVTVSGSNPYVGLIDSQSNLRRNGIYFVNSDGDSNNPSGFAVNMSGDIYHNNSSSYASNIGSISTNDILGFAIDMDSSPKTCEIYKNGSSQRSFNLDEPPSGFYMLGSNSSYNTSSSVADMNFGSPAFSISSGNADGNGYGNFEYSVPSGYYSINSKNLAEFG
jgi:hypothetical protein